MCWCVVKKLLTHALSSCLQYLWFRYGRAYVFHGINSNSLIRLPTPNQCLIDYGIKTQQMFAKRPIRPYNISLGTICYGLINESNVVVTFLTCVHHTTNVAEHWTSFDDNYAVVKHSLVLSLLWCWSWLTDVVHLLLMFSVRRPKRSIVSSLFRANLCYVYSARS